MHNSRDGIVKIVGLEKYFNKKEVLNIAELSFEKGKIYGVIGPSGAGKSTLLRIINFLEKPSKGNLYFNGSLILEKASSQAEVQKKMSLVFQKPVLFNTSVKENLAFGLNARGADNKVIERKTKALLEKVGLENFSNRSAKSLSGGEGQRLALARAIAFEPELLLLDEPTANLDPANVEIIESLILDLNKELGTTIIIVTHNTFQARRVAEEIIFLYQGKVVEKGVTEKVFSDAKDPRTKAFVEGRMVY